MRIPSLLVASLALALAASARAETVEVNSTTMLNVAQQTRGGQGGQKPDLVDIAPAFEILSIRARGIVNPVADDLDIVLGTWGSYEFNDHRWDTGTDDRLNGDVQTLYVSGKFFKRMLTLRAGREQVSAGIGRMVQIDGGEAIVTIPFGLRLSGYVGSPVTQRFGSRNNIRSWNPMGGDFAYGGRASWATGLPGLPGRGFDLGVSANVVRDGGDIVREEVGADFRVQPWDLLTFSGFGAYSIFDGRFSEANVRADWVASRKLQLNLDWRFVAPDLFISRTSILSVFSDEQRNYFGGGFTYGLGHGLLLGAEYHLQLEPGDDPESSDFAGHEAEARLEWERGGTLAGVEAFYLHSFENGYIAGRIFGRQDFGPFLVALDVLEHHFEHDVNGEKDALTGTLTGGVNIGKGFSGVVAGTAGMTPFLEREFQLMVKLVYNQSYAMREVR